MNAVASAGAASPLVQLACCASVEVQHEAIGILCQLAHQSHELPSLVEAGVVPPLVAQLHSSEAGAAVATALENSRVIRLGGWRSRTRAVSRFW